jgi:hypothetical protein
MKTALLFALALTSYVQATTLTVSDSATMMVVVWRKSELDTLLAFQGCGS